MEVSSTGPLLSFTGNYVSRADVQDSDADVSVTGLKGLVEYKDFSFSYERLDYSWSDSEKLPFGNGESSPWDILHALSMRYSRHGSINSNWKYFVGGAASSAFEEQMQNSYGFGVFSGATYIYSPTLQFTLGTGFVHHEIQTKAVPVVGISWNQGAAEGLSVAIGFPDTSLSYRFNPQWKARSRILQFDQGVYRLADDSTVEEKGFLEKQDLVTDLEIEYSPIKTLSIIAGVQYFFKRELTFHDDNDDHEQTFDLDNAWGGVLSVSHNF
jgi:hypothetical protein